jgi:S-adenosyl-L-methionine hydrolase (adenosine-forming)
MTPIITLTTDFGLADHYVAAMKGVLLTRCPQACLVDITHAIPPFSLYAGAYALDQVAPYFPSGTIHLVVVDPGVGTARKPLLVEALGQLFIAPDNGVLSLVAARDKNSTAREITNQNLWLPLPSATFHGRDLFAPAAAAMAAQTIQPKDVGPLLDGIHLLAGLQPQLQKPGLWSGRLLSVDRFGNAVTNFKTSEFKAAFSIRAPRAEIREFRQTFGDAAEGVCFLYAGSSGYWEIGMNQRSAADFLQLAPGDAVTLQDTIS